MQKKIIALAVAGLASTAAFAQTNVVIYGIADATFDVVDVSGGSPIRLPSGALINTGNDVGAFTRVSTNSSYIGFKGTEDLGNGLKAVFQFENGVSFDSGSGSWASRDSYVGLSHANAGTIVLGNLTGPTRALGANLDVFAGATGIGANSGIIGKYAGLTFNEAVPNNGSSGSPCDKSATCTSIFDTRWKNAIAYMSPNWGGFSFAGAYVANENKTREGLDNTAAQRDTWGFDVGAKWEGMGFMVGATYNWAQVGDILDTEIYTARIGASYTAPIWSVRGMFGQTGVQAGNGPLALDDDQQYWGIGGTFNIGAKTRLLAQYYQALESSDGTDNGAQLAAVGVEYSLSKRTMLKATYAWLENQDRANFDFGINAAGSTGVGSTNQGLQMGVRHAF
jgi:predicted porin